MNAHGRIGLDSLRHAGVDEFFNSYGSGGLSSEGRSSVFLFFIRRFEFRVSQFCVSVLCVLSSKCYEPSRVFC